MKKYFKKFSIVVSITLVFFNYPTKSYSQTWNSVGANFDNNVYAFVTDTVNNVIYAAGHFFNCGALPVNHIAKWDGTSWSSLGTGTDLDVYSVAMYNGELYIAGQFFTADGNSCNRIARWDGTTFQPMGAGMNSDVFYLHVFNGELYAAGNFITADGIPAASIAKWNGTSWDSLGSGMGGFNVYSIQNYNGELYAAGSFNDAGGISVNNIAKWDGTSWSDVGGGLTGLFDDGYALTVYKNELYVTGSFLYAGSDSVNSLAKWNGSTWSSVGTGLSGVGGYGTAFGVYNGELYLGGNYLNVNGSSSTMISRYNGIGWNTLGSGCDQEVDALAVYNGELFVGGAFNDAGGLGITKVAKWSSGCTAAAAVSGQNISCLGACDGEVSVYAAGNAPFNYLWSNGNTTESNTALCPGIYAVTVTDSSGCAAMDSIEIFEFALPTSVVTGNSPVCFGQCNGSAVVSATGFVPFSYSWSTVPLQTTDTATLLCSGIYYVTVTDSAGCSVTDSITIVDPAAAVLSFISSPSLCPGLCNGTSTVNTSSLFPPFAYSWSTNPVQTDQTSDSLCAGTYIVTVTDSLGCISVDSVTISDPVLTLGLSFTDVTCNGNGCDGTAVAFATGPAPFTYVWSTTDSTDTITNLCPGSYSVVATDSNNCSLIGSVFISQILPPAVSLSYTAPLCYGDCNGIVNANASGVAPFIFSWTNGGTDSTITNACFGWNTVTVTDSVGCYVTDSILVFQPDTLVLTSGNTLNVTCNGDCDGYLSVNISGGTPVYSYLWSTGSTQPDQLNLCAGTYTVTVTDAHGCTNQFDNSVTEPDSLIVDLTSTDATCQGCNDGTLSTSVTGGTPPYNYFFTPIGVDTLHVSAGIYYLCVTDANACLSCDSTVVSEPNGVFEFAASDARLLVYPNPFNSTAVIAIPSALTASRHLNVHFYNVLGEEMRSFTFTTHPSAGTGLVIDRKNVPSGMYLFKVTNKEGVVGTGRFIVK